MSMRRSHRDYLALPLCLIYNRTGATEMHDVILLYYCGLHMGDSQMQFADTAEWLLHTDSPDPCDTPDFLKAHISII